MLSLGLGAVVHCGTGETVQRQGHVSRINGVSWVTRMLKPRYFSSVDTVLRTSVFISCVPKDEHFCIR